MGLNLGADGVVSTVLSFDTDSVLMVVVVIFTKFLGAILSWPYNYY